MKLTGHMFCDDPLQIPQFGPQDFSITIWALAKLKMTPPRAWLQYFYDNSMHQLGQFSDKQLANASWALAQLKVARPPYTWWKQLKVQLRQRLEREGSPLSFKDKVSIRQALDYWRRAAETPP